MRNRSSIRRTREEMVNDVVIALTARLSPKAQEAVLKDVFSEWTEYYGKLLGCPYWSEKAWELRCEYFTYRRWKSLVRHEHAVPKKVVKEKLLDVLLRLGDITDELVRQVLDKFLVGVVVTIDEEECLNAQFKCHMPGVDLSDDVTDRRFLRYKECKITIGKVEWRGREFGDWKRLPGLEFPRPRDCDAAEPTAPEIVDLSWEGDHAETDQRYP